MRKVVFTVVSALCLCFCLSSCYPELSVQQYDTLKEDIAELNEQTASLEEDLSIANAELEEIKSKNAEVRLYVDFMVQLIATQNSESLLLGEFDVEALVESKEELMNIADGLDDTNIGYYMSLIDSEKEIESQGAYYKAIEYCIKNIKTKLGVTGNANTN